MYLRTGPEQRIDVPFKGFKLWGSDSRVGLKGGVWLGWEEQ